MGEGVFLINEDVAGLVDDAFCNFVVDLFLRKYGEALPVVAADRRLTVAGAALPTATLAAAILPVAVLDVLMLPLLKNGSVRKSGIFSSPVRLRSKQCVVD